MKVKFVDYKSSHSDYKRWKFTIDDAPLFSICEILSKCDANSIEILNDTEHFEFTVPKDISNDDMLRSIYINTCESSYSTYKLLVNKLMNKYLIEGLSTDEAEASAICNARHVLPSSTHMSVQVLMTTDSVRKLVDVLDYEQLNPISRSIIDELLPAVVAIESAE